MMGGGGGFQRSEARAGPQRKVVGETQMKAEQRAVVSGKKRRSESKKVVSR